MQELANEDYCYLTTRGRVTGRPHRIEIWFALDASEGGTATLYMLAGGRHSSDWVRNVQRTPAVSLRIADRYFSGDARLVDPATPEDARARELLVAKYAPRHSGSLDEWGRTALPVAVDLAVAATATTPASSSGAAGEQGAEARS